MTEVPNPPEDTGATDLPVPAGQVLSRRSFLRRGIVVAGVAAAAPALLAACGGDEAAEATGAAATTEAPDATDAPATTEASPTTTEVVSEPVELTLWKPPHTEQDEAFFTEQIARFTQEHPQVSVSYRVTPWEQYLEIYTPAFAAGDPPDVHYNILLFYPRFSDAGQLADLAQIPGADLEKWRGLLNADHLGQGTRNGVTYGLPFLWTGPSLVWNKKLFRDAGLDPEAPPTTWEEVVELARVLTKPDGSQWGFGALDNTTGEMVNFAPGPIVNYGGDLTTPDDSEWVATGGGYVDGLETHVAMFQRDKTAAPLGQFPGFDVYKAFLDGKIAMIQALGQFIVPVIVDYPDFELGIAAPPGGPLNAETFGSVGWWMVAEASKHKAEAWQLIEFLSSPEVMGDYARLSGLFAARTDVDPFADDPIMQGFTKGQGPLARWPVSEVDTTTPFMAANEAAYIGARSAEEALADAAQAINAAIAGG